MQIDTKRYRLIFLLLIVVSMTFAWTPTTIYSFHTGTLQVGSRGKDVSELQGRLTLLGYYHGKMDGQYGWATYRSVRTFQHNFGMKVDGIAGPKTKQKLLQATTAWKWPSTSSLPASAKFSNEDITLMARAVYGEARGEPYIGQVAIAAVILNRLESSQFPTTISGVIFQPGAFTAVNDGQIWLTPGTTAFRAARDAINGWDPSGNALYYFNPATATSKWIWSRAQIKQIGKHIFAK